MTSIAVVGAGLSGITTVKQLLDEGHDVICCEKSAQLGGVFAENQIYDDLHLTISNYFMAFSDFMPVHERLKFWSKGEYRNYLHAYVKQFNLGDRIQFGTEVVAARNNAGQRGWTLTLSHNGKVSTRNVDVLAVCSGHFQHPRMPTITGLESFSGEVIHSKSYRDKNRYQGKRVLCVGMGESSADITSEVSEVAARCILSLRRYQAVAPRYMAFQEDTYFTIDTSWLTSRIVNRLPQKFHQKIFQGILQRYLISHNPDLRIRGNWAVQSGSPVLQAVTKNERVFKPIADGKVIPHIGGIERFDGNDVVFKDGAREAIDAVIFCTGYQLEFPFLDVAIDDMRRLYKQMFVPKAGPSLAFIGFVRPQQGGIPVIAELQARYLAQLCSNKCELPSEEKQRQVIAEDAAHWRQEYRLTPEVPSLVNYCHYMDSLAKMAGCMPEIPPLWRDPKLHLKMLHGPQFALQYRLAGPHATPELARKFLLGFPDLNTWRRTLYLELNRVLYEALDGFAGFRLRYLKA